MNYRIGEERLSNVELKAMLVSRGIKVSKSVYNHVGTTKRLTKNPLECNTLLLPDNTIVQLTDLSFHMEYIRLTMNWDTIKQLAYAKDLITPFSLKLSKEKKVLLYYKKEEVCEVSFLPPTNFYKQKTSSALPFIGNAVLQGADWVSFQMLWECDCALANLSCQYCYSGGELERIAKKKKPLPTYPTATDAAEIVEYAITHDGVNSVQITGGTLFNTQKEVSHITQILEAINKRVGPDAIKGEILVYVSPTISKEGIDAIYEAGASRVSMSVEIWDRSLAEKIMPGKSMWVERDKHLEILTQVAKERGKGSICSNFIVGLEPLESLLEGARYLGSKGVVPIASVWIPFGRPVEKSMKAPPLDYYRQVISAFKEIYEEFGIAPPGERGLNVCMCRDIYLGQCC